MLLISVGVAIVLLLLLITKAKVHPFVALLLSSYVVGVGAGMPLTKIAESIQTGFGNALGFIGIVLGLGSMLGKLMEESGGAHRIARTLMDALGPKRIHWAMMFVAFIVGIPIFFQVGFVLLIPLVFTLSRELRMSLLHVGLPMVAGLSVVHGILPPHPAALAVLPIYHADIGKTILYGIIVSLPAAILAGPVYAGFISKRLRFIEPPAAMLESVLKDEGKRTSDMPGFAVTLFTILLPVLLLLLATYAEIWLPKDNSAYAFFKFIGHPITALVISLVFAFFSFGFARKMTKEDVSKHCDKSLPMIAGVLLILGAGGAFSKVLVDSGVGTHIAELANKANVNPIVFAWLVATLIRVSTGSATVAMIAAAGIVAPVVASNPAARPELIVLATGAGSLMLSHVNDAGFWLVKEYFGMSLKETFLTWTALETILGVAILVFTLLLSLVV